MARKRRRVEHVIHEPAKLSARIKVKLNDEHFAQLVICIASFAINHAMSPADIIDAGLGSIHHLEMFSYRMRQKGDKD